MHSTGSRAAHRGDLNDGRRRLVVWLTVRGDRGRRPLAALAGLALVAVAAGLGACRVERPGPSTSVAIVMSLSGPGAVVGRTVLDGARLAVDEANADGSAQRVNLVVYDDRTSDDGAREVAQDIAASPALLVVGPGVTTSSAAAGPLFAAAGLASIVPYAHGAGGPGSETTFRPVFSVSEMGAYLASYLHAPLGGKRAVVIHRDNAYGRPFLAGFRRAAERVGLAITPQVVDSPEAIEAAARQAAADPAEPAIVLGMVDGDSARALLALRRQGARSLVLGTSAIARDSMNAYFADEPEERRAFGAFTEGVYAASPVIFDSANADSLAFAERYRAKYGSEPSWEALQGYDATRLAIRAALAADASSGTDLKGRRMAAIAYLRSLDGSANAAPSLTGPLWFGPDRGREQAVRIGRFSGGRFESAPLQIVPVTLPDTAEIATGAVFAIDDDRFARLQRVVYTGVYLNEIPRIDLTRSSFNADFYLWLRYAGDAGQGAADPTDLSFPTLMSGSFDRVQPAEQRDLDDGTQYRLWRVQGEFRNDFGLHRYPFDRQRLSLAFFNARAPLERIVYAVDRRSAGGTLSRAAGEGAAVAAPSVTSPPASSSAIGIASEEAFRNLTQWDPLGARVRRESLVTRSGLGDPGRIGIEAYRELSGFLVTVDVQRRAIATLVKSLMPLLLMTLIMYAALHFPVALVKEKVTVAITAVLSGAVLLAAINSQLGSVGYTIAVEYVFYAFFGLGLLGIVSVLGTERLRASGRNAAAARAEVWTRVAFVVTVAATLAGLGGLALSGPR